jgi:hypothetical protein
MLLIDMWAEFAGIYIGFAVLLLGQSNALYYPFRPFRKYPELFHGGNYYAELAFGTVLQIATEIINHTVCLVFETRRGLQPLTVWRELPTAALIPIILFALVFATKCGQARSTWGDSLDQCNRRDLCWCVGSGRTQTARDDRQPEQDSLRKTVLSGCDILAAVARAHHSTTLLLYKCTLHSSSHYNHISTG